MKHWCLVMDLRTEMLNIYEANYPETLRRIFIINGINEIVLLDL